jgi:glucan phosphoethanolaminetransferase (alkaline phosphatase superfamily)
MVEIAFIYLESKRGEWRKITISAFAESLWLTLLKFSWSLIAWDILTLDVVHQGFIRLRRHFNESWSTVEDNCLSLIKLIVSYSIEVEINWLDFTYPGFPLPYMHPINQVINFFVRKLVVSVQNPQEISIIPTNHQFRHSRDKWQVKRKHVIHDEPLFENIAHKYFRVPSICRSWSQA